MTVRSNLAVASAALGLALALTALSGPSTAQQRPSERVAPPPPEDFERMRPEERERWRHHEGREGWRPPEGDRRPPTGGDWQQIGVVTHTPQIERQTIPVGREAGRFGRIGLNVTDGSAEVIEVQVVYGNGTSETFPVNAVLSAQERPRAFDLNGEGRSLQEVTVVYKAARDVRMEVIADPLRISRPGPRWQQLGCQRVELLEREDVIRVGGTEGRFGLLKLTADGGNVRLDKIKIVYANGTSDLVSVRTVIPDGTETRALELAGGGRRRQIDRIELYYLPQLILGGGRATVCAYGS